MSSDGDDLGLELRLPWGRPTRLPDPEKAAAPPPAPPVAVAPPSPEPVAVAPPQAPVVAPAGWMVAPVPTAPAFDPAELQRSLETLLVVLEGRFDRIEERLVRAEAGATPGAADDAGTAPSPEQLAQLEQRVERTGREIETRFERLERVVVVSHQATMDAVELVARAEPAGEVPGSPELVAAVDRLEQLEERIERTGREMEERFERLERLVVVSHQATMDAVELVARAEPAGEVPGSPELVAAVDRLEALLAANHRSTMEAVAEQLPGLVDLEPWCELIDRALRERIDQVKSRIDSSHAAIMGAMSDLDPAHRVAELAESIVATGESLDVELTELRRLLSQSAKSS